MSGFPAKKLITFDKFRQRNFQLPWEGSRILFIHDESGNNQFSVHLNQPFPVKNLYLRGYDVHGVPTVGGIPNYTFMNMLFHGGPQTTLYLRSDNQPGIPIGVDNTYTSHDFSPPMLLSDQETNLQNFSLEFTNPDGSPAFFTGICLWFVCENPSPQAAYEQK